MRAARSLLIAALLALSPLFLRAQVLTKTSVSLPLAKSIAASAQAEAAKNHWTMVIVVIDDGGNLVYLERMDGTQLGSVAVAEAKAKTALYFKRPSKTFEDGVAGGRNTLLSVPNVIAIDGGLPLVVNGEIVGAIGVSGMQSSQDGIVAKAGVDALAEPAPIPVVDEWHHHLILENTYVRVLDVWLSPGEQTLYHLHQTPSVVVSLSHATAAIQVWGAALGPSHEGVPGDTRYAPYDEKPLRHRVFNTGGVPFHTMDIELVQPNTAPKGGFPAPLSAPAKLLFEHNLVRAYRLSLSPGESMAVPASAAAHLLVSYEGQMTDSAAGRQPRIVRAGMEAFDDPNSSLSLSNEDASPASAILFELESTQ